jgi:RND family efflux transporter MFP subunit
MYQTGTHLTDALRRRNVPLYILVAALSLLLLGLTGCGEGAPDGADAQTASSETDESADADKKTEDSAGDEAGSEGEKDESSTDEKPKKRRERTTSVTVSKATIGPLVIPVIAEGTIRARHSADLSAEVPGRIMRIAAEEGQFVRKGALIAKIDDREYELAAAEARAKYIQSISLLAIEDEDIEVPERPPEMQQQIDELADMERKGLITREERLAREIQIDVQAIKDGYYRVDVITGRSGVAEARASVERARIALERTEIRAPFSGIITGLELSNGELVSVGQAICTLVNNTDIEAQVGVLESDIGHIEVGRAALIVIPALGDTLPVTVDVISPQFDRDSRTADVLLRLKNTDGKVLPGMFARAIIAGERIDDCLLVPKEAILTRDGRPLLFKVDDNQAKWLYLKLGRENDRVVEVERVLQGGTLGPDDLVVVTDHLTLSHDAKVKVKKVLPVEDPWRTRAKDI